MYLHLPFYMIQYHLFYFIFFLVFLRTTSLLALAIQGSKLSLNRLLSRVCVYVCFDQLYFFCNCLLYVIFFVSLYQHFFGCIHLIRNSLGTGHYLCGGWGEKSWGGVGQAYFFQRKGVQGQKRISRQLGVGHCVFCKESHSLQFMCKI